MEDKETIGFFNLYRHGFIRAAVCIPEVRIADPRFNAGETIRIAREAAAQHACIAFSRNSGSPPIPTRISSSRTRCFGGCSRRSSGSPAKRRTST